MSSFLVNLVRRGAGLPAATIQAPPSSPFGPEIRKHGDRLTEELATDNTAGQTPLRARSSDEPPFEAPTHPAPSIQRRSGAEFSTSIQSVLGEPTAAASTPPLWPRPPRQNVIPGRREAQVSPMAPPNPMGPAVPPFQADREVITEIDTEQRLHTPSAVAQEIMPAGESAYHTSSVAPGLSIKIEEPGERQVVPPTIRPAPAESHALLPFPKTPSASSPTPASQPPIHVRIGRVEVRAAPPPTSAPARPSPPAPLGFDGYYRVRTYRS